VLAKVGEPAWSQAEMAGNTAGLVSIMGELVAATVSVSSCLSSVGMVNAILSGGWESVGYV